MGFPGELDSTQFKNVTKFFLNIKAYLNFEHNIKNNYK